MKIANRVDHSGIDWTKFKYIVFDIPNLKTTYRERYEILGKKIDLKIDHFYQD